MGRRTAERIILVSEANHGDWREAWVTDDQ